MNETSVQTARPVLVRYRRQRLVWGILLLIFIIVFLTQLRHLHEYGLALMRISPWWMAAAITASAVTYLMSAAVVMGAAARPLPFVRTLLLQFATSFVNFITPFVVGEILLTQRFLEHNGLKRPQATASTALVYAAGLVTHVVLLAGVIVFVVHYPLHLRVQMRWFYLIAAVLALSAVVLAALPKIQLKVREYVRAGIRTLRRISRQPGKLIELFGGSVGVSLFYAAALFCSLRGFGVTMDFDKVFLVYLAGSTLAAVSPMPGGLGTTEVGLIAGFVTFGVSEAAAILSILTYRIATYFLPILPGIFAFRFLQKKRLLTL